MADDGPTPKEGTPRLVPSVWRILSMLSWGDTLWTRRREEVVAAGLESTDGEAMTNLMHQCPVPECERNVGSAYLMCRSDWWRVKHDTRSLVYDTFNDGLGLGTPAYLDAKDQAISEAVASRARAKAKANVV